MDQILHCQRCNLSLNQSHSQHQLFDLKLLLHLEQLGMKLLHINHCCHRCNELYQDDGYHWYRLELEQNLHTRKHQLQPERRRLSLMTYQLVPYRIHQNLHQRIDHELRSCCRCSHCCHLMHPTLRMQILIQHHLP